MSELTPEEQARINERYERVKAYYLSLPGRTIDMWAKIVMVDPIKFNMLLKKAFPNG